MRLISIDVGLNNFTAITNNIGQEPILIRGKKIKADNQWYNKVSQDIKEKLRTAQSVSQVMYLKRKKSQIATDTVESIIDYFNAVSSWIIQYCIDNRIDNIIIGKYRILEKENFTSIPFKHFYSLLETKCMYHGINFTIVSEQYTSGTSFFDDEPPVKEYYDKSRRVHKHLWRCNDGEFVNADINDSYQIMRKAHPEFFEKGVEGFQRDPKVIDIKVRGDEDYV